MTDETLTNLRAFMRCYGNVENQHQGVLLDFWAVGNRNDWIADGARWSRAIDRACSLAGDGAEPDGFGEEKASRLVQREFECGRR